MLPIKLLREHFYKACARAQYQQALGKIVVPEHIEQKGPCNTIQDTPRWNTSHMLEIALSVRFPWLALLHPFLLVGALSMLVHSRVIILVVRHSFPTQSCGDICADIGQHLAEVVSQIATVGVDAIALAHLVAVAQQPDGLPGYENWCTP
jgi:hypothetical protein